MLYLITGTAGSGERVELRVDVSDEEAARAVAHERGMRDVAVVPASVEQPPALSYQTAAASGMNLRGRWAVVLLFMAVEIVCLFTFLAFWTFFVQGGIDVVGLLVYFLAGIIFLVLQLGILVPVLRPKTTAGAVKAPWMWLSALAIGVSLGFMIFCGLLLVADVIWALKPGPPDDELLGIMVFASLLITGGLWLLNVPLVYFFMRKRPPESALARLSAFLFLGSVVEFIAGIPVLALAQRKQDCTCAHASFWSMILGALNATLVLGPMVFLIILARRSRAVSRGLCAACGYDLSGLADRAQCPQCGAGWKPAT